MSTLSVDILVEFYSKTRRTGGFCHIALYL